MDVAAEILAEMALGPPQGPTCHFMRLPLELRKRIYALLLLPPPVTRVHCSINSYSKQCSPGGRLLASTCKPKATVMRTIGCGTCEWRGGEVHAAILSTSKAIHGEASDVLYENSQALCFRDGPLYLDRLGDNALKVRRFVFVLSVDSTDDFSPRWLLYFPIYSNIKVIELHFDLDLTKTHQDHINAEGYGSLGKLYRIEMVIDVHIICAWDELDGLDWCEPISRRGDVDEVRALALDEQAKRIRLKFIDDLGEIFKTHGNSLAIKEN